MDKNTKNSIGYDYLKGKTPIIISAPHAVIHERNGKEKFSEPNTKNIAENLHTKLSTHSIIKNNHDKHDANSEIKSYFRNQIIEIIKSQEKENPIILGIDIHQCSPTREQDLIIGTNYGKNIHNNHYIINTINKINNEYNYNIVIDKIFPATEEYRVSTEVSQKTNTPYIQIEINSKLFHTKQEEEKVNSFLEEIVKTINTIQLSKR